MNKNVEHNQTQFAAQEPIRENVASYAEQDTLVQAEQKPAAKNKKLVLFGIIAFVLFVVFMLLLILIMMLSPKKSVVTDDTGKIVETNNGESDPLLQEIYLLNNDLDNADPTIDAIPFPPVEMELRLDPPQKN